MERSLIWVQGAGAAGWACSSCSWKFPVPTLLGSEEGKDAYDRLAAAKFRDHKCETQPSPAMQENPSHTLTNRARVLIQKGYKPRDAVELLLQETALECRNDAGLMEKARAEAEDFLSKISKGLI